MSQILAADIGGTNSRFGHFSAGPDGSLRLEGLHWLATADADSFPRLIRNLRGSDFPLRPEDADIVVLAIAGPVEEGIRSSPPLIPWDVDLAGAADELGGGRSFLINDFIAQAYACISPIGDSAVRVLSGQAVPGAVRAVLGAGTGLGKALLVPAGNGGYIAIPSEGGHANFPFVSKEEHAFQEFLLAERGERYITGNTVVSGKGLSYIHRFLSGERLEPHEVAGRIERHPATLQWTARFFGRACRNFALETFSCGGMYIAGGVAAKLPELVMHKAFEEEFRSSDTLSHLLERIPVFLIRDENSGLWGAAVFAQQRLAERK